MGETVFDRIRAGCAAVAGRAHSVRIDGERLRDLATRLGSAPVPELQLDPAHHFLGDDEATLAYVITLDAINFGSGYFPKLAKRSGLSGYLTVATALKERFEKVGPWGPEELTELSADDCADALGQDLAVPEVAELMGLFARALGDLGRFLRERCAGRFQGPVAEADHSAARLVQILASMPLYRDVAHYCGIEVPFFKRAQITAADLAAAFRGRGVGLFHDLDQLTAFADNLVPHVLRCEGVLVYAPELERRIDAGEPIEAGSPQEVEIRAAAVTAVERCVEVLRDSGATRPARELDWALWSRGQRAEFKARPRHRTRSTFY